MQSLAKHVFIIHMNAAKEKLDSKLSKPRKVLIVNSDNSICESISHKVDMHLSKTSFIYAHNYSSASLKIENDPPDIIIIETKHIDEQAKKFVQLTFDKLTKKVGFLIITELPDKDHFIDEVVHGQIQLLHKPDNEQLLTECLARIMNFLNSDKNAEFTLKFLAPSEILIEQGDLGDTVYILLKGQLHAIKHEENGDTILGKILPGEFVGEMAYINKEERSAKVIADVDCELIEIPSKNLDHVLFSKPAWSKALMKTLSKRVKSGNAKA